MSEETTTPQETPTAEATTTAATAPAAPAAPATSAPHVFMERDPAKVAGIGVCNALVPDNEVANFKAAGWTVVEG